MIHEMALNVVFTVQKAVQYNVEVLDKYNFSFFY